MKDYQKPKIIIILISDVDIVTTSGELDFGDEENEPMVDLGDF